MKSRPGTRIAWLGGINKCWGGYKKFNAPNLRVWTKKQRSSSRISTNSGVKTKKKGLHLKKCTNFHDFGVEPRKKGLYWKSAKKQFLLTNSGVTTSILRVSGLELYSSSTEPVTFFGAKSSLGGGHNSRLGGGTVPECLPRSSAPGEVLFCSLPVDEKRYILNYDGDLFFPKRDERKPRRQGTQHKSPPEVVKTSPLLSPSQPTFVLGQKQGWTLWQNLRFCDEDHFFCLHPWICGHESRSAPEVESRTQGSRPRTPKNSKAMAKNRPSRGEGHRRKCSPKKRSSKIFFRRSQKKGLQKNFSGKKGLKTNFSGDLHFRKTRKCLRKFSSRLLALSNKNSTVQKIVLSSSRGQGNFRGIKASRPRTSKCVLEDVLEGSTSDPHHRILSWPPSRRRLCPRAKIVPQKQATGPSPAVRLGWRLILVFTTKFKGKIILCLAKYRSCTPLPPVMLLWRRTRL